VLRLPLVTLGLLLASGAPAVAAPTATPDRVIVGFDAGADRGDRVGARAAVDATLISTLGDRRQQLLAVDGDVERAVAVLEDAPGVAYAEPDAVVRALWTPNDPFLGSQWALGRTRVPAAWDSARGAGTLVGVVDTGGELTHPDLGRFPADPGYDFVNDDGDPTDDEGHGTGVTGVIAASADNGRGVAGVAPSASVIEAKALDATGSGYTSDVTAGVRYLAGRGARVVNLSLGGSSSSTAMSTAFAAHPNTLFVAAAGNENADNDAAGRGSWPCNDPAPNVLCVGASTTAETRASFSNYGSKSVDLVAPGQDLRSTTRGAGYADWSGTSFSAPVVAGAAALLYSARPAATVAQVRMALLASVDVAPAYAGLTVTGGRLNAAAALAALFSIAGEPPPAPAPAEPASAPVGASPVDTLPPAATPMPTDVPALPVMPSPAAVAPAVPPAPAPTTLPPGRPADRAEPCGHQTSGSAGEAGALRLHPPRLAPGASGGQALRQPPGTGPAGGGATRRRPPALDPQAQVSIR
jgi:subtilisin family serine protease